MRRNTIEFPTTNEPVYRASLPWRDTRLNNAIQDRHTYTHLWTFAPYCATFLTSYILVINSKRYGITDSAEYAPVLKLVSL
jgi:hypothetical protein